MAAIKSLSSKTQMLDEKHLPPGIGVTSSSGSNAPAVVHIHVYREAEKTSSTSKSSLKTEDSLLDWGGKRQKIALAVTLIAGAILTIITKQFDYFMIIAFTINMVWNLMREKYPSASGIQTHADTKLDLKKNLFPGLVPA